MYYSHLHIYIRRMDLMYSSGVSWPYELEDMEEEARLIHESEWQLEMMRPFDYPLQCSPKLETVFGDLQIDLIQLVVPAAPDRSAGKKSSGANPAQENVVAERKRREKLNQGFIHLSSLLPGLKKLDKASVLDEAVGYVKQLQAQVKELEEQTSKREKEIVVSIGKPRVSSTEERNTISSVLLSDEKLGITNPLGDQLLEVEARISYKDVFIKVHCERKQERVAKVLEEIQRLNLDMINYNAMDFGKYAMVITVLAKMNEEFSTANNLVKMLQQRLQAP